MIMEFPAGQSSSPGLRPAISGGQAHAWPLRTGQEIPRHGSKGEVIVHCLEGRVAFTALGKAQALEAGELLVLPAGESHTVTGIEDASLLLTILAPRP